MAISRNKYQFFNITLKQQLALLFIEINPNILQVWYNYLGYITKSILFKMAKIIEEINLTKPIPKIASYKIYKISILRLKPYNSHIQLEEAFINFIHLDILGLFKTRLNSF